ncbi:MAG: polyketide synthase, partial [Bacteroidetes bacterium]|nr:polyketide synthase [Bacteroidota bacterium]
AEERGTPGKMYCRHGSFIEGLDLFDAGFFNISPREAQLLDPQQRMVLEVSWQALEHAHIPAEGLKGSLTGVFIGVSSSDYSAKLAKLGMGSDTYSGTGGALSAVSGRLSYFLGLQGPCLSIDTACSSSLVAIHAACQSLRLGDSDIGIAGGVNVTLSPDINVGLSQAQMLSADGHCNTFSNKAAPVIIKNERIVLV